MQYQVKSSILGFENLKCVELYIIDDLFATLKSCEDDISFTVVNPYLLREYSFDVPMSIRILLDMNENTNVVVYNITIIQDPLENSGVNFLAPLVFNQDNGTMAQVVLDVKDNPTFGLTEAIKKFKV